MMEEHSISPTAADFVICQIHSAKALSNFYWLLRQVKRCENPYTRITLIECVLSQLAAIRQEEVKLSRVLAGRAWRDAQKSRKNNYVEEGQTPVRPLTLMPPEMWQHVGDQLDSINWHSLSSCNQFVYNSLKSRQASVLLPDVLKIMFRVLPRTEFRNFDVIQCRSVCKRWKSSIVRFLTDQECRLDVSISHKNAGGLTSWPAFRYHATWVYLDEARVVAGTTAYFLNLWMKTGIPKNPFPSRDFSVLEIGDLNTDVDIYGFRKAITNLLRHFGSQLLGFSFSSDINNEGVSCCWYYTICGWLKLMGNLKRVNLDFRIEEGLHLEPEHLNELEELLVDLPFPKLENLVVAQFDNVPCPIINSALAMNPHIQKLKVNRSRTSGMIWRYDGPNIRQLTDLSIVAYAYREITQLKTIKSPLRSLQILTGPSTGIYCSKRLFSVLKKFRATLNHLKLELRNAPSVKEPLFLENLTSFHVIFHGFVNLDFILPLKALEELSVVILDEGFDECEEIFYQVQYIQFAHFIEKIELSNIWRLFPKLKKIRIDTSNCRNRFNSKSGFSYSRPEIF